MPYFYAEDNRYGTGTMTTIRRRGRDLPVSAGTLYRFASRAARDAWVDEDPRRDDGRTRREVLTAAEARRWHGVRDLARAEWYYPFTLDGGYDETGEMLIG